MCEYNDYTTLDLDDTSWQLRWMAKNRNLGLGQKFFMLFIYFYLFKSLKFLEGGHAVAQLVVALRYKSEGYGFDSRWCNWNFLLT